MKLQVNRDSHKIGLDEIEGLTPILNNLFKPLLNEISEHTYWIDNLTEHLDESEYKSRDGFMAYDHNCGGLDLTLVLPKCEMYSFEYVDFGECWEPDDSDMEDHECDEHCDAKLRIWLKFEGLDEAGTLNFYLYMGGGNGDAPYFRVKDEQTYFETQFEAKTLNQVTKNGKKAVNKLLKLIQGVK